VFYSIPVTSLGEKFREEERAFSTPPFQRVDRLRKNLQAGNHRLDFMLIHEGQFFTVRTILLVTPGSCHVTARYVGIHYIQPFLLPGAMSMDTVVPCPSWNCDCQDYPKQPFTREVQ